MKRDDSKRLVLRCIDFRFKTSILLNLDRIFETVKYLGFCVLTLQYNNIKYWSTHFYTLKFWWFLIFEAITKLSYF